MRPSVILVTILIASVFVTINFVPTHAAGFSISLNPTVITVSAGGVANTTVTITNNNGSPATIGLSGSSSGFIYVTTQFFPNSLTIPNGGSASSMLRIQMPSPDVVCQGNSVAGPYSISLTVQGTIGGSVVVSSLLTINLLSPPSPVTVSVTPDKQSYTVGQTVTLSMTANPSVAAQYSLRIDQPDGSLWGSAQGYLPATYTRQAEEPTGTYTATLTATYCGIASSTTTFSVEPSTYDITISIAGLPSTLNTTLRVDGNQVGMMKGGDVKVMSYPIGTSHTFEVDQYVSGQSGYRYYVQSDSWTAADTGSYTFNYVAQYYLTLGTSPENVTSLGLNSGWYSPGTQVQIPAVPTMVNGSTSIRYVFSQWTVDGVALTQNGPVVTMNSPHSVAAVFKTQYRLLVDSEYGDPQGTGYYDSGSTAQFSVTSPVGAIVQQVFLKWEGDYNGTSPQGSIVMDQPHVIHATWTTNYLELYAAAGAGAVVIIVALILLRRRRGAEEPVTKPTPPAEGEKPPAGTGASPPEAESKAAATVTCSHCGVASPLGLAYCTNCGEKLG